MGYETHYKLSTTPHLELNVVELEEMSDYDWWDFYDNSWQMDAKWYSNEKDLKAFSLKHPETLFLLEGEGEENDDIWRRFVKNGQSKYQSSEIKFPEPPEWAE